MTGVFLQARIASTRLANKALLPLRGPNVLEHAMAALREVPADVYAVLTDSDSLDSFRPYTKSAGFELFAGDPLDVLDRYVAAATHFETDIIVRATGDNPLVSHEIARETLALRDAGDCDYAGIIGNPLGTGVEVVRAESLRRAREEATDSYEREHVTPFLYRRPERFSLCMRPTHERLKLDARVTLDTPEDYELLLDMFDDLYRGHPVPVGDVVSWLTNHPARRLTA